MTAPAIGIDSSLVVGGESAFGTVSGATDGRKIGVLKAGIKGTRKLIENAQLSSDPNLRDATIGREDSGGAFSIHLDPITAPYFLKRLTNSLATTGSVNFVHTSKPVAGQLPSLTIEEGFTFADGSHAISQTLGGTIESFKIPFGPDGFADAEMTLSAQGTDKATVSAFTSPLDWTANTPFSHDMIASTDVLFGTMGAPSAIDSIESGDITITNRLEKNDYRTGGSLRRASCSRTKTDVKVQFKFMFTDATVWDRIRVFPLTPVEFSVKWTINTNTYFKVRIPRLYLSKTDPAIDGEGPITLAVEGTAAYDATAGSSVVFEVGNQEDGTKY